MTDLLNEPLLNVFLTLVIVASKLVAFVTIIIGFGFAMFAFAQFVSKRIESELVFALIIILGVIILIPLALTLILAVLRSLVL